MRPFTQFVLCPVVLSLSPILFSATSQAPIMAAESAPVAVEPVRELRADVDAWPLIANPSSEAEQRVNATLTGLNRSIEQALRNCDADYLKWSAVAVKAAIGHDQGSGTWSRKVQVTMKGPRFLSLVASDEYFCGGAHPDEDQLALVFDLSNGHAVNWLTLVAKSAGASAYADTIWDGTTVGALVMPELKKMAVTAADPDCKDAFLEPQAFQIWPDAKRALLVAQPFDLPHVQQVCANEIDLTLQQARGLGFDETLLGTIEEAHRQIQTAQKP